MALLINNTAINPNTNDVYVNNVAQNKVYINNVQVWERIRETKVVDGVSNVNLLDSSDNGGFNPINPISMVSGQGLQWYQPDANSFGYARRYGWVDFTNINLLTFYWNNVTANRRGQDGNPEAWIEVYVLNWPNVSFDAYGRPNSGIAAQGKVQTIYGNVSQLIVNHPSGSYTINTTGATGSKVVMLYIYGYYMNQHQGQVYKIIGTK
jgi:hypothetical protein